MSGAATDRVERSVVIQAPRTRVWRALTNAEEFGAWFGANLKGQRFEPRQQVRGQITICGYENIVFDAIVERVEPEDVLAFRWHPYAIDPTVDYSQEERTLVTFTLEEADGATVVRVVESGFDKLPPQRRVAAFPMNDKGWAAQLLNIKAYAESR
jgi:uncharacterized protein YndB with AHSA1/START domain